ncbi:DUF1345 domain-containing protein [Sphingomonas antarctica]
MLKFIRDKIAPPRFIAFVVTAIIAGLVASTHMPWSKSLMIGFDVGALVFFVLMSPLLWKRETAAGMRRASRDNDANRAVLLGISTIVSLVVLTTVALELGGKGKPDIVLIVTTLALAWLFANTIYALHYAHLYYLEDKVGGLDFQGDDDPDYADFVYFAFTLGMTFQTSDTGIQTRRLRRIVTIHSFAAFVFNIGVLAFTINVLGGSK